MLIDHHNTIDCTIDDAPKSFLFGLNVSFDPFLIRNIYNPGQNAFCTAKGHSDIVGKHIPDGAVLGEELCLMVQLGLFGLKFLA